MQYNIVNTAIAYERLLRHSSLVVPLSMSTKLWQVSDTVPLVQLPHVNYRVSDCHFEAEVCGLFSRIIRLCNSSIQNCQSSCSKCALCTWTKAFRWRRCWLIAASTIDWSNCAHSSIRRVLNSWCHLLWSGILSSTEHYTCCILLDKPYVGLLCAN